MRIGYIKGISILRKDFANKEFCEKYKVNRIFADKHGEWIARREMINYLREGDEVVVEDVRDISDSVGELMELLYKFHTMQVHFCCEKQRIYTALKDWERVLSLLDVYEQPIEPVKGRAPRYIEDLDDCIDMVNNGIMTVTEACEQMNIGRSTYYRRARIINPKTPKERHTEDFDMYEHMVMSREISIAEACRRMNIGVSTYYKLRKDRGEFGKN